MIRKRSKQTCRARFPLLPGIPSNLRPVAPVQRALRYYIFVCLPRRRATDGKIIIFHAQSLARRTVAMAVENATSTESEHPGDPAVRRDRFRTVFRPRRPPYHRVKFCPVVSERRKSCGCQLLLSLLLLALFNFSGRVLFAHSCMCQC